MWQQIEGDRVRKNGIRIRPCSRGRRPRLRNRFFRVGDGAAARVFFRPIFGLPGQLFNTSGASLSDRTVQPVERTIAQSA